MKFRTLPTLLVILCALIATAGVIATRAVTDQTTEERIRSAVVKVFVHSSEPDLLAPWQKSSTEQVGGSGVLIGNNRVLTNAHVVEHASHVEIKQAGGAEQYTAKVLYMGNDCDLALLEITDEAFPDRDLSIPIGGTPPVQGQVHVYGFPVGGETISVTSGILSRLEVETYAHSFEKLLVAQIDAAINSGNSGGPVIMGGNIVGIAMQTLEDAENISYMIPAPVVRHFLDDVEDGSYDGFPMAGARFQALDSSSHRASLGMNKGETGALVIQIDHGSPAAGVLQPGDVILAVDGVNVANDLSVSMNSHGRVNFEHLIRSRQMGEQVSLKVLREGARSDLTMTLTPHRNLVPGLYPESGPPFLVFGGALFMPLTVDYITSLFEEYPEDLVYHTLYRNRVTADRSEIILLMKVLPHDVNRGYQDWEDYILARVNGTVPQNMEHLGELIDATEGEWVRFEMESGAVMVLDVETCREAANEIRMAYGIPEVLG